MPLSDRDRRTLKWGGIIAGVLLLALLGVSQLGKGGGEALPPLSPVTGVPSGPTGGPTVVPSGTVSATPGGPSPSPIFAGRDPFSIPPGFPGASGSTPSSPGGSTTGPPTTGTTTGPTSTPTAPSNGSSTTIGGHTVVLIDTFTKNGVQMATVEVDGTVYNVAEGDSFAGGTFTLRDVAGNCATFLYGDQSFTLCIVPQK
jgi:hypothetical protein